MVSGMRTPSPTPPPQPAGLGRGGGGLPRPGGGWAAELRCGRAGGSSSANVGCVGEQRALRHLPAPSCPLGLGSHPTPRPRCPPPPQGAGEGRVAQPGHPAHAKPGWQLGICFLAAWLLATKRCILGRVVRGAGGGRCLPPAPRCATRAPELAAPRHRGDPELGAGSGAGKVWAHRPPPSTSWRPCRRTGGLCPGRAGPRAGLGPPALSQGCSKTAAAPGLLQSWRCGEGGERRARGARAHGASVEHRKQPGATASARGGSGSTRGCQPSGSLAARVPGLALPG